MDRVNKNVLQSIVNSLNSSFSGEFKLEYCNSIYSVFENNKLIFNGSASDTYYFLSGFEKGLKKAGVKLKVSEQNNTEKSDVEVFLQSLPDLDNSFTIRAKKVAKNTYFSQEESSYSIKVMDYTKNRITFITVLRNLAPNGVQCDDSIRVSMLSVKISECKTLKDLEREMLKKIDKEIITYMADGVIPMNMNRILWINGHTRTKLGITNTDMDTVSVHYRITT